MIPLRIEHYDIVVKESMKPTNETLVNIICQ